MMIEYEIYSKQLLDIAKSILSDREYDIVYTRAYHSHTYQELGIEYNVTSARIRQIHEKALAKIRKVYEN